MGWGMTVEQLIALLLARKSTAAMASALENIEPLPASKQTEREIKKYIEILAGHLRADRRREALATALALMITDAEYTIPKLRRAGMLRASRYDFQAVCIATIADTALKVRHLLNARPDRFTYLESVLALTRLAPSVRKQHIEIKKFLRLHKKEVIKTILAHLNCLFYFGWTGLHDESPMDIRHFSVEELCEAGSLLISMYRRLYALTDECCNFVDEKSLKSKRPVYDRLFVIAAHILKFMEAESLIDGLPYKANYSKNAVTVLSIDPEIEKSVRLGYIQSENQTMIRAVRLSQFERLPSIKELVQREFRRGLEDTIKIVESPVRRLVFNMPDVPEIFHLFSSDELLREEAESLMMLDIDDFSDKNNQYFDITSRVSSQDIFKLQRYFLFISCIYQEKLKEIPDEAERALLMFRSTVFVIPRDHLIPQINYIFRDEEKTKEIIDLLTLDEGRNHVDLLYSPFILTDQYYIIAPHIVASSNLVRNIIYVNNLKPSLVGRSDPMQQAVVDALEDAGFMVRAEVEVKISGKMLEMDIVAWRDNVLFIFECKNAYHPCSTHEMRTSFDHLKAARKQLDIRLDTFLDPARQKILFAKLGWKVVPSDEIYTGILIGNRVFHGAHLNDHPVRQAHEFINVVLRGEIGSGEEKFSFWAGTEFQTIDLVSYLKGESVVGDQLSALQSYTHKFRLGSHTLNFLTYQLAPQVFAQLIKANYRAIKGPDVSMT